MTKRINLLRALFEQEDEAADTDSYPSIMAWFPKDDLTSELLPARAYPSNEPNHCMPERVELTDSASSLEFVGHALTSPLLLASTPPGIVICFASKSKELSGKALRLIDHVIATRQSMNELTRQSCIRALNYKQGFSRFLIKAFYVNEQRLFSFKELKEAFDQVSIAELERLKETIIKEQAHSVLTSSNQPAVVVSVPQEKSLEYRLSFSQFRLQKRQGEPVSSVEMVKKNKNTFSSSVFGDQSELGCVSEPQPPLELSDSWVHNPNIFFPQFRLHPQPEPKPKPKQEKRDQSFTLYNTWRVQSWLDCLPDKHQTSQFNLI